MKGTVKPKKNEAKLVGQFLHSPVIVNGLIEGIPTEKFDVINAEIRKALDSRGAEIQEIKAKRQEYLNRVQDASQIVSEMANESKVEMSDVVGTLANRSVIYVFPNGDGTTGKYRGKGAQPGPLTKLIENGASLEDFAVSLDEFLS
ncbi:hypothetical protein A1QO_00810 [Vibrio genomosp. F10 str. ZF-129]|uniref:Histone-like protein H-NS C-terminal domain-containing protein n=1 Tax=Vibrio genomosp. F10 str. ZF-129 TaxID=1187848 RepID=A0A1E5BGC7_9VIBR|nr:hypothetical protein [Vibrio genomosp. F10]OEE35333.1 hypothetical protein A1QO_00810 [Vibrio genomosp. F10 str. ZF-129]